MSEQDPMPTLLEALDATIQERKAKKTERETPSEADVTASQYMKIVLEGQKRCARRLHGIAFEG